jgi:hypothetical protein
MRLNILQAYKIVGGIVSSNYCKFLLANRPVENAAWIL